MAHTGNFEGWSVARIRAWRNRHQAPNEYCYRFNEPGQMACTGSWSTEEHKAFMERVKEIGVNFKWGIFSIAIPGRVGYLCANYWRKLLRDGWVEDPNYRTDTHGSLHFITGSIPEAVRRYSFSVIRDPSGVFDLREGHPLRPPQATVAQHL